MTEAMFSIPLNQVIDEFQLEKIFVASDIDEVEVSSSDVNRPALQIAGFYDYFNHKLLQVLGKVEITYLNQFASEGRWRMLEALFEKKLPAVIKTRGIQLCPEIMEMAEKYNTTLLRTDE